MSFVRMCNAVSPLISKAHEHPFNKALLDGSLPKSSFRSYLEQDFLYLHDFSKALLLISNKLTLDKHAKQFKQFAEDVRDTQRNLHLKYLGEPRTLGLFSSKQFSINKVPAISNYTKHLFTTANTLSVEAAVASLIPCFWLYNELGKKMLAAPGCNKHNPYYLWIMSYSNEQFTASAKAIIQMAEELGDVISCPIKQENIVSAFVKSTEHEILFWDWAVKSYLDKPLIGSDRFAEPHFILNERFKANLR